MDDALLLWVNHAWAAPWADAFFTWLSQRATFAFPVAGLVLIGCAVRYGADGVKLWLLMAVVTGATDFTGNQIKHLTHEPRPCYALAQEVRTPGYEQPHPCGSNLEAMPSNHAANFFAAAVFIAFILRRRWVTAGLLAIAVAVSLSRIYLGKHYPSQVAAGAALGSAIAFAAAWTSVKYVPFIQRIRALTHERPATPGYAHPPSRD